MKNKNELLTGSITRALLKLSVPIVLANLLQTAYQLTDLFWLGRLGDTAVAAVALCFPIAFFFLSLGIGLTLAGSILVAQYKGKGSQEKVDFVVGQSVALTLIAALLMSVLGYIFSPTVIDLMNPEKLVAEAAVDYLHVTFIGMVFVFGFMSFQALLRGVGEVRLPALIVLGTVLLNLIVDPLFILGWGPLPALGVAGAAWATAFTQSLAFWVALILLTKGSHGLHLRFENLRLRFTMVKKIFALGLPSSVEMSARSLGMVMMTFLIAAFGTTVTAAYGIGHQSLSFVILPAIGLAMATTTLVGQNIGAGQIERAEKVAQKSALLGFMILSVAGILIFLLAELIANIFVPGEEAVIAESVTFVRIMAFSFGFLGIQKSLAGVLQGAGKTGTTMIIVIISLWVFQIPFAYFLSHYTDLGVKGLWLSIPISNVLTTVIITLVYLTGGWKKKRIT